MELPLPDPATGSGRRFLLLSVKDRGPLGDKLLLGEAVVALSEITRCDLNCGLEDLQQVQLALTTPGHTVLDILTAIETRK